MRRPTLRLEKKFSPLTRSRASSLSLSLSFFIRTCPRKGYARRPGCGSTTSSVVRNGKTPVTSWPLFASSEEMTGPRLASSEKIWFWFGFFRAVLE